MLPEDQSFRATGPDDFTPPGNGFVADSQMLSQNQKKAARRVRLQAANMASNLSGNRDDMCSESLSCVDDASTPRLNVEAKQAESKSATVCEGTSSKALSQSKKRAVRRARLMAGSCSDVSSVSSSAVPPPRISRGSARLKGPSGESPRIRNTSRPLDKASQSADALVPACASLLGRFETLPWASTRIRPKPIPEQEVQRLIKLLATPHQYYIFVVSGVDWKNWQDVKLDDFHSSKTAIGQHKIYTDAVYLNVVSSNRDMAFASIARYLKSKLKSTELKIELVVGGHRRYEELLIVAAEKASQLNLYGLIDWFADFRVSNKIDIMQACRATNTNALSTLLTLAQGDVDVCEYHGMTAVHIAAMYGNYELASAILCKAADSKKKDWCTINGRTPLHYAVSSSSVEFVELFVKFATSLGLKDAKDSFGRTANDIASCVENFEAERLLSGKILSLRTITLQSLVQTLSSPGPVSIDLKALPSGLDVYNEIPLHNYGALVRLAERFLLVPPEYLLHSMAAMEVWYGKLFSEGLSSHLHPVSYLIPVWAHLESFRSPNPLPSLGRVLVSASRRPPSPVASEELFLKRLDSRTRHVLSSISWANVMLIGGMALSCFVANNDLHAQAFRSSDVDLYIVGLSGLAFRRKVAALVTEIYAACPKNATVVRTSHTITIVCENKSFPTFQVILAPYSCPAHLLFTTDMDCTALGFDGAHLWATPRAREAIVRRENVVHVDKYNVRGEWQTEARLTKYAQRGFQVVDLGMNSAAVRTRASDIAKVEAACALLPVDRYDEAVEMVMSTGLHGAGLLLMLESVPRLRGLLLYQPPEALAPGTTLSEILDMVGESIAEEEKKFGDDVRIRTEKKGVVYDGDFDEGSKHDEVTWGGSFPQRPLAGLKTASGGDSAERKSVLEFWSGYCTMRTRMIVVNPVYWPLDGNEVDEKKLPMKQRRRTDESLRGKDCSLIQAITELDIEADKFPVRDWYDGLPASALVVRL